MRHDETAYSSERMSTAISVNLDVVKLLTYSSQVSYLEAGRSWTSAPSVWAYTCYMASILSVSDDRPRGHRTPGPGPRPRTQDRLR